MAGFYPRLREGGDSTGETRQFIIDNSVTMTLGDAVNMDTATGGIDVAGIGERLLGVVVGFVDQNELPLDSQHVTGSDWTHSGATSGTIGVETVATAADNVTDSKIKGVVIIDPNQEYYNDANDDLDQTDVGQGFDVTASGDQIDASTVSSGEGQFICMSLDPDNDSDDSKGLFRIAESLLSV